MPFSELRAAVAEANVEIFGAGLVVLAFGNASAVDRAAGVMAIKPSGMPYLELTDDDIVVVALDDGRVVEGTRRPSSDTPTHLDLYRRFPDVGGVVHTHSPFATAWAQARRAIPPLGTTHADHFHGPVPVTRPLSPSEITGDYEANTGLVIGECFEVQRLAALHHPGVLVASHGPFTWGVTVGEAVTNAIALEAIAAMALRTLELAPDTPSIGADLLDRHFERKHGATAYYGQPAT